MSCTMIFCMLAGPPTGFPQMGRCGSALWTDVHALALSVTSATMPPFGIPYESHAACLLAIRWPTPPLPSHTLCLFTTFPNTSIHARHILHLLHNHSTCRHCLRGQLRLASLLRVLNEIFTLPARTRLALFHWPILDNSVLSPCRLHATRADRVYRS